MAQPKGRFARELDTLDLAGLSGRAFTDADVDAALARPDGRRDLADLAALLSPGRPAPALEELAQAARASTLRRFGRAVRLYAPLYVSNACLSSCTYCGFARDLPIARRTLHREEVEREARAADRPRLPAPAAGGRRAPGRGVAGLPGRGASSGCARWCRACRSRPRPGPTTRTSRLVAAGLEGVVHYQETYDRDRYAQTHTAGWKRDYDRRLNSTELAGAAGVRRLGIGALLGLAADWRADVLAVAAHAAFLVKAFWRTEVTVSLPRIKPSASGYQPLVPVSDAEYVQALVGAAAVRAGGRDRAVHPGAGGAAGRAGPDRGDHDVGRLVDRAGRLLGTRARPPSSSPSPTSASPAEVAAMLVAAGYEPVWKDAFPLVEVSH